MTDAVMRSKAAALVAEHDRTLVMGVVNVTPDSFSDGGVWFEPEAALAHGRDVLAAGADIVDVGGESTRPGADRPSVEEELRRVLPVVRDLAEQGAVVSIDTMRASVAAAALDAGASVVNDVSGGLADPEMVPARHRGRGALRRHALARSQRRHAVTRRLRRRRGDVCRELASRRDELLGAGLSEDLLVLDPGLGFSKTADHNWSLLAALPELHELGHPILLGASRKAFLGRLGGGRARRHDPPPSATSRRRRPRSWPPWPALWCVRVHDVESTARVLAVVRAALEHHVAEEGAW